MTQGNYGGMQPWTGTLNGADAKISHATAAAMGKWNNTTSSTGTKTPYYFSGAGGPTSNSHIIVVKMPEHDSTGALNPIGQMETGGALPLQLRIREDVVNKMTEEDLARLIAHELAHRIGLSESYNDGTCSNKIVL